MKNNWDLPLALSFDDVLIVPKYSDIVSRKNIDLRTNFSRRIKLNMPIVSANMDTVTESQMAIAMAREGGLGVIHRFNSIDTQVSEVEKVKRAETLMIHNPITIGLDESLKDALVLMKRYDVGGILVTGKDNLLLGILTARDVRFRDDYYTKVRELMTPKAKLVTALPGVKKDVIIDLIKKHKVEKIPLMDKAGILKGLVTATDFMKSVRHAHAAKDSRGRLLVGAAVGVKDGEERAERLVSVGCDALVIDIAHGHHESAVKLVKLLKKKFKEVDVVAGNVATAEGTIDLIKAGADAIKVGIGPGKACSTRVVSGSGMPQFTAVMNCALAARKFKVPVIADGGLKNSGDLAKAIGAGGDTAMIGGLFAGTAESPGDYFLENGAAFKVYRGLASREASADRGKFESNKDRQERAAEGISTTVSYKGEVSLIVQLLLDGLQSGMSYSGAKNILEFWKKVSFVRVSEAGIREGQPRP